MSDHPDTAVLKAIERLQKGQESLQKGHESLLQEIAKTRNDLHQEIAAARQETIATRAAVMGRIDRLQDELTTARETEAVNFGAAERAERMAKGVRADLDTTVEQLNALVRIVRVLSNRVSAIETKEG
jgi:cobalamin biosynthesis protein CbiD